MSASFARPERSDPPGLGDKLRASGKTTTADNVLFAATAEAQKKLDAVDRTMFARVNNDANAANSLVLSDIRRIARDLMVAADEYEFWS